ncbi:MAG: hypothetical protein KDB00_15480 [Planctomycetales bacterium]|nr:hypothetical protein [Planctomycetales bacterium]
MHPFRFCIAVTLLFAWAVVASAAITDFGTWTLVQDPAHPGFTASATSTTATLSAGNLAIPAGTDIGYQSVNGSTPGSSSNGFYFSPLSDFSLAIDYAWSFSAGPTGFLGLGFGIGEDADGMNSAGVAMVTSDGSPFLTFAGAARINDVNQSPLPLGNPIFNPSTLSGTLFVQYQAASGDVTIGAATSQGAGAPTVMDKFVGIGNQWSGDKLMTSFFIRSDESTPGTTWSGGNADAVFSNFRVLNGSAVAIPEPSTAITSCLVLCLFLTRRTRHPSRG